MLKLSNTTSTQSFLVEDVVLSRLPEIHELDKYCFGLDSYSYLALRQLFELSGKFWSCILVDNELIGYLIAGQISGNADSAWLLAYGVAEKFRNHGLGLKLLNNLSSKCLNSGIHRIFSTANSENASSLESMKTAGYFIDKNETGYFGEKEDRLVLIRDLSKLKSLKKLGVTSLFKGYASGNPTIIILSKVSEVDFVEIDQLIKSEFKEIEQVGFLDTRNKTFMMAGHEFCGNASRIAANYLLKPDSSDKIKISGLSSLASMEKYGNIVRLQITLPVNSVSYLPNGFSRIKLEGISFLAIKNDHEIAKNLLLLGPEELMVEATKIFKTNNIEGDKACGLLIYSEKNNSIKLSPYIYINESNSFCMETSCSSGSIAISLLLKEKGLYPKDFFKIEQPSGELLTVKIIISEDQLKASVEGPIKQSEILKI
jgi:diaminopimelate epimerase/GNAT superfamily N-acetyltransferase